MRWSQGRVYILFTVGLTLVTLCLSRPLRGADTSAERVTLQSARRPDETTRAEVLLEVAGDLKLVAGEEVKKFPLTVVGKIAYDEKLLGGEPGHLAGLNSLRYYQQADATIKIEQGNVQPQLNDQRRLISVVTTDRTATFFSPNGLLTREELDLIDVPGDSLLVEALLPGRAVAPGESWQPTPELLAALLNIDAVGTHDVQTQLVEFDESAAKLEAAGNVSGAIHGVATEIELKAKFKFDRELGRITWFAMVIKEQRSIGHVDPGVDVVARLQMKLTPHATSEHLDPAALKQTSRGFTAQDTLLSFESLADRVRLAYDRDWFIINEEPKLLVLRRLDRGELVAQCNISLPGRVKPDELPTIEKFQHDIQQGLGKNFGQFLKASQSANQNGYTVYRVEVSGQASELPVQWNYYLVSDAEGNQAVLLFTLESELVERLGNADQELVNRLQFIGGPTTSGTEQPTQASK